MKIPIFLIVLLIFHGVGFVQAEPGSDQIDKETINAAIDRKLGWLDEPPAIPDIAEIESSQTHLPNRFAWQSNKFMQGGPPPYAQQPENLDAVSIASAILSGEGSGLTLSQQAEIFQSVASNPGVQSALSGQDGGSSGSASITKSGSGTLTLGGGGAPIVFEGGNLEPVREEEMKW